MSPLPPALERRLSETLGGPPNSLRAVGGGDVSAECAWTSASGERFFVKWNAEEPRLFAAEAEGLAALAVAFRAQGEAAQFLTVPEVVASGEMDGTGFLVLRWFDAVTPSAAGWGALGRGLAALHRVTQDAFGFRADNFIGRLPQTNDPLGDWTAFWSERRVLPMLRQAGARVPPGLADRIRRLVESDSAAALLADYRPVPALLHGDLWSGNVAFTAPEQPIVFDPAVYYGEREVELAFTELFGGFSEEFYAGYDEVYPRDQGYVRRRRYWQIYPLLVHVALFDGSYVHSLQAAVDASEAEARA